MGRVRRFGNISSKFSCITDCGSKMIIHQLQVSFVDVFLGFYCTIYVSLSSARAAHAPQSLLDSRCQFQCMLEIEWSLN